MRSTAFTPITARATTKRTRRTAGTNCRRGSKRTARYRPHIRSRSRGAAKRCPTEIPRDAKKRSQLKNDPKSFLRFLRLFVLPSVTPASQPGTRPRLHAFPRHFRRGSHGGASQRQSHL